jgi:hypothetical protein
VKQIRTSELEGPFLDWAVGQCLKLDITIDASGQIVFDRLKYPAIAHGEAKEQWAVFSPSTLEEQGQQIVKQEQIVLIERTNGEWHGVKDTRNEDRRHWEENRHTDPKSRQRQSPPDQFLFVGASKQRLVAAMRSLVAAQYGSEIAVPEDVLQTIGLLFRGRQP